MPTHHIIQKNVGIILLDGCWSPTNPEIIQMIKINIDSNRTNDIRKNDKFAGILVLKLNLM